MKDKKTTHPQSNMAAKLKGDGPITLTKAESNELRETLRAVLDRDNQLLFEVARLQATDAVNIAMGQALQRQGFVMKSVPQPDGKVAWDLQNAPKPPDDAPTIN